MTEDRIRVVWVPGKRRLLTAPVITAHGIDITYSLEPTWMFDHAEGRKTFEMRLPHRPSTQALLDRDHEGTLLVFPKGIAYDQWMRLYSGYIDGYSVDLESVLIAFSVASERVAPVPTA